MGTMASPITSLTRLFTQPFIQTQIKENIKVAFVWGLHRGWGVGVGVGGGVGWGGGVGGGGGGGGGGQGCGIPRPNGQ